MHSFTRKYSTIGCCGLDCALCPRYYTEGSSRCPGCAGPGFFQKHPSCSFITCCVGKHELEICAKCNEFPCSKFSKETGEKDSFVTHRNVLSNQNFIKENGLDDYLKLQKKKIDVLNLLLSSFDDGRSKSFFCFCTTLMDIKDLEYALDKVKDLIKKRGIDSRNKKEKAKVIKEIFTEIGLKHNLDLKLRK